MYEEDKIITLEDYHIDLLMLQSDTILYDINNNVTYYDYNDDIFDRNSKSSF